MNFLPDSADCEPSLDAASSTRSRVAGAVAVTLPLALYAAQVALYAEYLNDDAYITFRYSRFLATGLGPYYNPGEHVEGYTNLLLMLLMAPVYALGGESAVPRVAKALGAFGNGAALVVVCMLGRRVARGVPALARHAWVVGGLASSLAAVTPGYALNAVSGLETGLFTLLVVLGVYLSTNASERWRGAGLAWGAAALARPEGAALFGVHWILRAAVGFRNWTAAFRGSDPDARERGRRVASLLVRDALIVTFTVAAHVAFRYLAYDGELLPNTYWAKAEGFLGKTPWEYIRKGALRPFFGPVGALAGVLGWLGALAAARRCAPLLGLAAAGVFLPALVGADWMPGWRFSVPFLPLAAVVVSVGWMRVVALVPTSTRIVAPIVGLALVAGALAFHQEERLNLAYTVKLRHQGYRTGHLRLAEWIRDDVARPGDGVALMDIGVVGYLCADQTIVDITGLTDRHIAKSPGPFLAKSYDPSYVLDRKPHVIVLVLWAPGSPLEPVPLDVPQVTAWTPMEVRLWRHPEFDRHYRRPREPRPDGDGLERLAATLGAERVFVHAYPATSWREPRAGRYYFLAAFVRDAGTFSGRPFRGRLGR